MTPAERKYVDALIKDRNILDRHLALAKRTIVAFLEAHDKQRHGHTPDWSKVEKLVTKCEDEMDLDDNGGKI